MLVYYDLYIWKGQKMIKNDISDIIKTQKILGIQSIYVYVGLKNCKISIFSERTAEKDWELVQKDLDACMDDLMVLYGFNIGGWMVRFLGKCKLWG